jgi:hypothetical protein
VMASVRLLAAGVAGTAMKVAEVDVTEVDAAEMEVAETEVAEIEEARASGSKG